VRAVLGRAAGSTARSGARAFGDPDAVTYAGSFEVVRASLLGRVFAWLGTLVGTPVAPRVEDHVESHVFVAASRRWRGLGSRVSLGRRHTPSRPIHEGGRRTRKTRRKTSARLCMPLDTFEEGGVLHFVSRGYYFDLRFGDLGWKVWLPALLSPGVTHVEHIDLGHGWFRFTMTVTHPLFGEVFFQTGRFSASEELS
jgi:hypothetical protein